MDFIQHNPYRIVGVLSNATTRELEKQKGKIRAFVRVGREIESDFDFRILEGIDRSEEIVNQSFSSIEQNQDKVDYALFWFLNASPFDNTAIEYLKNGDEEKAIEIWEKVTTDKEVNSKNFSAFNNLGTYKLLSDNKSDIKLGIQAKIKLIESDYFENFVHSVADETYTIDQQKQSEKLIDELLAQYKNQFSSSETLQLFSGCNGTTQQYLSKKFTEEPLHKIENQIESCKKKRKASKGNAYEYGLRLFTNTKEDLSLLKSLLGTSDLKYKSVADQLANEIMQCGIDYFNECKENDSNENFLESAQKLTKLADSIAVGRLTKDRAKDSLETLADMKDREVNQAINLLRSVRDSYKEAGNNLISQLKKLIDEDIELSAGVKQINISSVKENIYNSIDWERVNELLINILSNQKLIKIKQSYSKEKKDEFYNLMLWLNKCMSDNSVISNIKKKYDEIPPKLPFIIKSSEIINIKNKPLYTKFLSDIRLRLNLEVLESNLVVFCINKSSTNEVFSAINFDLDILGSDIFAFNTKNNLEILEDLNDWHTNKLKINRQKVNYKYTVEKNLNGKSMMIDLPFVNGSELNKVEVYVDDILLLSKTLNIEQAPSEKLVKEIANEESKLKKINQTDYYASQIKFAKSEMDEIQKFKLFRGSSEKQRQLQAQQTKIDKLIKRSKEEKKKDVQIQEERIYKLKMELSAAKY